MSLEEINKSHEKYKEVHVMTGMMISDLKKALLKYMEMGEEKDMIVASATYSAIMQLAIEMTTFDRDEKETRKFFESFVSSMVETFDTYCKYYYGDNR